MLMTSIIRYCLQDIRLGGISYTGSLERCPTRRSPDGQKRPPVSLFRSAHDFALSW